jgi:hypothetical protein
MERNPCTVFKTHPRNGISGSKVLRGLKKNKSQQSYSIKGLMAPHDKNTQTIKKYAEAG